MEGTETVFAFTSCREYQIPAGCIRDICNPGRNDLAVEAWCECMDWDQVTPEGIRRELRECGAWSPEELRDDEENRKRFLWVLAWNYHDSEVEEQRQHLIRRIPH